MRGQAKMTRNRDEIERKANEPENFGFMYTHSFIDPDGHGWGRSPHERHADTVGTPRRRPAKAPDEVAPNHIPIERKPRPMQAHHAASATLSRNHGLPGYRGNPAALPVDCRLPPLLPRLRSRVAIIASNAT
jgi:hypothetical protein